MGTLEEKIRQLQERAVREQEIKRIQEREAVLAQEFLENSGARELLRTVETKAWHVGGVVDQRSDHNDAVGIQLLHFYKGPSLIVGSYRDIFNREQFYPTGKHSIEPQMRFISVGLHIFPSEELVQKYGYKSNKKGFLLYVVSHDGDWAPWAYDGTSFDDSGRWLHEPKRTMLIDNLEGKEGDARKFIEDDIANHILPIPPNNY